MFPSNLNVTLYLVSVNIGILGKQNLMSPKGPVIKCQLYSLNTWFLTAYLCFQFRGKVAGQLSKVPVNDFDGVAMKGEVLNSLTQATDEVDEDAQVKPLTSVSSSLR